MLIYDPTLDPYHCAIRILAILTHGSSSHMALDTVRIADYFLAFPSKLADVRLPNQYRQIKKQAQQLSNPYRNPIGAKASFERMRSIFQAAASGLVAAGFVNAEDLKQEILTSTDKPLPEELRVSIENFLSRQKEVREFVVKQLIAIPLLGPDGLKHRSGLLEHRYDPT